ncbi:MAG: hypothetical protein ACYS6K_00005 [Planctomycetota bacterium]
MSSIRFVDEGMLDEIATRGWKYVRLVRGKLIGGAESDRTVRDESK